jgi:DNA invertase Pin-like site-specific DNA recombinase
MQKQPLAYSYVRMNRDEQARGDSLRRQSERSERYALENGLKRVEDFKFLDIGVSAYRGNNVTNGALGRFLQAVALTFLWSRWTGSLVSC